MSEKYKFIGDAAYDNLISGVYPAPLVSEAPEVNDYITGNEVLKRGTVIVTYQSAEYGKQYTIAGDTTYISATGDGTKKEFGTFGVDVGNLYELTKVEVGGVEKFPDTDYAFNKDTQTVIFNSAPASAAAIKITGFYGEPCGIVAEDVAISSHNAKHVPMYTAGCFDPNFLFALNDMKETAYFVDALRKNGIYLEEATK